MTRKIGIFADWKPLTRREKRWIADVKPDWVSLGLNDEGLPRTIKDANGREFRYVGSERTRVAWGRSIPEAKNRLREDVLFLRKHDVEPVICFWYDSTAKTNEDLMSWGLEFVDALKIQTVILNCEKAARYSTKDGHRDIRFRQHLTARGVVTPMASFAAPVERMLDWYEQGVTASGLLRYIAEAYSHRPPGADDLPASHWLNHPDWRPGRAQDVYGKTAVMLGKRKLWSPGVMGFGMYMLSGWNGTPRVDFRRMVEGCTRQDEIAGWSLKWAVKFPWMVPVLRDWRSGSPEAPPTLQPRPQA